MVAAALRRADGRFLMHRRPTHKEHGGLWEFPGGKVERDETPVDGLVRELGEELGIAVDPALLHPAGFAETAATDRRRAIVILLYTTGTWTGEPQALEEGAALSWFTPLEMAALARPPLDVSLSAQLFAGSDRIAIAKPTPPPYWAPSDARP